MTTIIIILFRLCGMSLVHHKAIIRDNRMCSYLSLWICFNRTLVRSPSLFGDGFG